MRNDEGGPVAHQVGECLLHEPLGFGVERRGRFVEDEDRRVLEDRPRDRQPLPLPAGQALAAFADPRIVLLRQLDDELVRVSGTSRRLDVGRTRPGRPVGDVARDALVEKDGLLRHDADLRAQGLERHIADVDAVHQDHSRRHVEESGDQVHERGLAGAAQPDDRNHLPGLHREGHVTQHVTCRAVLVLEAHVPELDPAPQRHERSRPWTLGDLGVRVEQLENPFRRGDRLLQVRIDAAELLDRTVHHESRDDEREEVALRHATGADPVAPVPDQRHDSDAAEKLHERRQHRHRARHLQIGPIQPLGGPPESRRFVGFGAERLDDAMARERFDGDVGEVRELFLDAATRAPDSLAEPHQRVDHDRRAGDDDEREPGVVVEHQGRKPHDGEPFAQEVPDGLRHRQLDLLDVVGDPRQQLTARPPAEEARRLIQDVPEQLVAQVPDHSLPHVGHQIGREVRPEALEEVDHQDRDAPGAQIDAHAGERQVEAVAEDAVEERLDEGDEPGRRRGVEQHGHDSRGEAPPIGTRVGEQPRKRAHSVRSGRDIRPSPWRTREGGRRASATRSRR